MKKMFIFITITFFLLTGCSSEDIQNSSVITSDGWSNHEHNWSDFEQNYEYQMMNKFETKVTSPQVSKFLFSFPRTYAWFDLVPVYRFNYYGNSRIAIMWEHTEAIFNCSIVDDEELISRLKKEGYSEVKAFNEETKFAWRKFSENFVKPKYFEQKMIINDLTYGSKTFYNKVVICEPFNNSEAYENEKVVFFDICCDNRDVYYEEVIKTIDNRPVTEMLNTSKEWGLIEPQF